MQDTTQIKSVHRPFEPHRFVPAGRDCFYRTLPACSFTEPAVRVSTAGVKVVASGF